MRGRLPHLAAALAVAVVLVVGANAGADAIKRASLSSTGIQGNGRSVAPSISGDGRLVAFESVASNLVPNDTNGTSDVFVHDRQSGQTRRVSVDSGGVEGNFFSYAPAISADGRVVAFASVATNLVPDDTNNTGDLFVHDLETRSTTRVSVDSSGGQLSSPGYGSNWYPALSADGRFVAFESDATNLVPNDTNGAVDVFVHDRLTGTTTRASVNSAGEQATAGFGFSSGWASLSADGRFVAFASGASNLANSTSGTLDVYVHDRATGATTLLSPRNTIPLIVTGAIDPSISADGRFVAFNANFDVFVHDRLTGTITKLTQITPDTSTNNISFGAAISASGRYVAFASYATNLVPNDTNNVVDIFLHDRQAGTTTRVSTDSAGGQANGDSRPIGGHSLPAINADGSFIAFDSNATNLVSSDTNGFEDVFVKTAPAPVANWAQQGGKLTGNGGLGYEVALSSDGDTALAGAPDDGAAGTAKVFSRSGGVWSQQGANLFGSDANGDVGFGYTVTLSAEGNTALIGGPGDSDGAGAAWIFTRSGGIWTQQGPKLTGAGASGPAGFGVTGALSADGNTALIGGPDDAGGVGAAWVFTRSGGAWSQQGGKLTGIGESGAGGFGSSVALSADGNTGLIGGPYDNAVSEVGAAWVIARSGSSWAQQGPKLIGSPAPEGAWFGWNVALSADGATALIGGYPSHSSQGRAFVFTRAGASWSQQTMLQPTTGPSESYFGWSVSLSANGNTAVIGGPTDGEEVGAAWMFDRFGTTWVQKGSKLVGGGEADAGLFGYDVALSADGLTAVSGGPADNNGAGAVWFFALPVPPQATVPGVVTDVVATAEDATATVRWVPPTWDGGAAIWGYLITPYFNGLPQTPISVGPTTYAKLTGLVNNAIYRFTVTATNPEGAGSPSAVSNVVVPQVQGREPPEPPASGPRAPVPTPAVVAGPRPPVPPR